MSDPRSVLREVSVVNVGLPAFGQAVRDQQASALDVDWRPPAGGDAAAVAALTALWGTHGDAVAEANARALERLADVLPMAVDVRPAREVLPVLDDGRTLIHSGPPITPQRLCNPQRRALVAACLFEGWATDRAAAHELLDSGALTLASGNEHRHVGPMTGVCSPSMPVWVVRDEATGVHAFSTLNEGPGKTLWFGTDADEAIARLAFFRDDLGPLLSKLLVHRGPVDVFALAAQGLHMGDELHMRSQATGNLLMRELLPAFVALGGEKAARFMAGNHHGFLNLTMAAAKCASQAAEAEGPCSLVSLISRNGTDVGVQLAGMPGRWFTAPAAPVADALLSGDNTPADAALDIGDSAVIECVGLGGMAVAAAPAVAAFFGGNAADAAARTLAMVEICAGRSARFTVPALDAAGTPVGIDARLVTELEVTPQITTGVLHASSGAGQIGAGIAHQPVAPFRAAVLALAATLDGAAAATPG